MRRAPLVAVLLLVAATTASAQEELSFGEWIDEYNVHRVAGYVTLGLLATTGVLAIAATDVHPAFGYATAAAAATTGALGALAYYDRFYYGWPHMVLNAVAGVGFLLNTMVLEGGSPLHKATGAVAAASATAAAVYLRIRWR